ncbi:MAG: hypothetical protein DYG92_12740 [Leptolyngbya sp. PLA1]|nr:hypothetical protein [Leptolyngbya sp. PLA1]
MARRRDLSMPFMDALEARQLLAADLSVSVGQMRLEDNGDSAKVPVIVTNLGDVRSAEHAGRVALFLSTDAVLDGADVEVTRIDHELPRVRPGESKRLNLEFRLSRVLSQASPLPPGNYYAIVRLEQDTPDANPANDVAASATTLNTSADTFGEGGRREQRIVFASGVVVFKLEGPGTGTATQDGQGGIVVTLTGTTERSQLRIVGPRSQAVAPVISSLSVQGSLKSLKVERVALSGTLAVSGGLREVQADGLRGLAMSFGGSASMQIKAGDVLDSSIVSSAPIKELKVRSWLDTDLAADCVSSNWMGKVESKGAFAASLVLSGRSDAKPVLEKVEVKSIWSGDLIAVGAVGQIQVGSLQTARVMVSGNLQKLEVKGAVAVSTIVATNLRQMEIKGGVSSSEVAVGGAFTDAAGVFAGTTSVVWGAGILRDLKVGGNVSLSKFMAAVDPMNGIWLDADDRFASDGQGGTASGRIEKIHIKGSMTDSLFASPFLPGQVKVGGGVVSTAGDARFITTLG